MKEDTPRKVFRSSDGSNTLYSAQFDEHYHSVHGAYNESMHVFIQEGLEQISSLQEVSIFEMGFGTGLNALMTYQYAKKHKLNIRYHSIELYPLTQQELEGLHLDEYLSLEKQIVEEFHSAKFDTEMKFDCFSLTKFQDDFTTFQFAQHYDLVYYDAFGPRAQPQLWTKDIFKKIYDSLHPNGRLVTYCAKGQVKRDLKSVGFKVEAIPGPPRKREMTRAIKLPNQQLNELK